MMNELESVKLKDDIFLRGNEMRSDVGWNLECDEGLDKLFGAEAKRRDNHGSQVALLRAFFGDSPMDKVMKGQGHGKKK